MGKKVLIISTSPRKGSNSEALADEFARGAQESGNEVEKVSLAGKDIRFCRGCFACQKTKRCVIRDDADLIEQKMVNADAPPIRKPCWIAVGSAEASRPVRWRSGKRASKQG